MNSSTLLEAESSSSSEEHREKVKKQATNTWTRLSTRVNDFKPAPKK